MAKTGFLHYYNSLGLDATDYLVHYDFRTSGVNVAAGQGTYGNHFGSLYQENTPSRFWGVSGSGRFTSGGVLIQNSSALNSNFWTHFFVYDKTTTRGGTLFSSLHGNSGLVSGHAIGVTDSNKLFFEYYSVNGPQVHVSTLDFAQRNMVAVVRAVNSVTFHRYNFDTNSLVSENFPLEFYAESFLSGCVGAPANPPPHYRTRGFTGYLDEYVYLTQALIPNSVKRLMSGFFSEPSGQTIIVGYTGYTGITGYSYTVTGVTGIKGYSGNYTSGGKDFFGDPIYPPVYAPTNLSAPPVSGTFNVGYPLSAIAGSWTGDAGTPLTGYLVSGQKQTALTGFVSVPVTGGVSTVIVVDSGFGYAYGMQNIIGLRAYANDELLSARVFHEYVRGNHNIDTDYDGFQNIFSLQSSPSPSALLLFNNGVRQVYEGYSLTGNIFGSGVLVSGNFALNGSKILHTGTFNSGDSVFYDIISGSGQHSNISAFSSGVTGNIAFPSGQNRLVFLNGIVQFSGVDYSVSGNQFRWLRSGEGGQLSAITIVPRCTSVSGFFLTGLPMFVENSSWYFRNGQRQKLDLDYVEGCPVDLLKPSGIFDTKVASLYNSNF